MPEPEPSIGHTLTGSMFGLRSFELRFLDSFWPGCLLCCGNQPHRPEGEAEKQRFHFMKRVRPPVLPDFLRRRRDAPKRKGLLS